MPGGERYLIVKPSSLGDVIHAFPAVSMLAAHRPDAAIDWVVSSSFADIVRCHPDVEKIILFRRKELGNLGRFPSALRELVREIRLSEYTAVLDLQGLLRSAAIARFARTSLIAGPAHPREKAAAIFYGRKLDAGPDSLHAVLRNMRMMADFLGIEPEKPEFHLKKNAAARRRIAVLMKTISAGRVIAVAPGARWPSKQWPVSFFADAANAVSAMDRSCAFVILGAKSESAAGEELRKRIKAPVVNLVGSTGPAELIEAIRMSGVLFCNDSGPMHIAAALGVPVVALFGPTDPGRTGPFSDRAAVLTPDLDCLRCFRYSCPESICHSALRAESAAEAILKFAREGGRE